MGERRRQYYTDQIVQGNLLKALVAIEIVIVLLMLVFLYLQVSDIIDSHLYRVHPPEEGAWPELFSLVVVMMVCFLAANVMLLYLVHRYWSRYIGSTIRHFSTVLDRILLHNFSGSAGDIKRRHPMAELVELWYEKEKARNHRINQLLRQLGEFDSASASAAERDQVMTILQEYRRLLKAV